MKKIMNVTDNPFLTDGSVSKYILLADDDTDDCMLFGDAINELQVTARFAAVHNGELLMELLNTSETLPDILFMDLNMPRKNGFECLSEIRQNSKWNQLPVVIMSTSFEENTIARLYQNGAQHYIRKPHEFSKLKEVIQRALIVTSRERAEVMITESHLQPLGADFVLSY